LKKFCWVEHLVTELLKLNLVTTVGIRLDWGWLCWDCWCDYCMGVIFACAGHKCVLYHHCGFFFYSYKCTRSGWW